jgi:hypothetical protein
MSAHEIMAMLLWSVVINYTLLFVWFGTFVLAHDRLYRLHRLWFKFSVETFDTLHYTGIGVYKIGILLFNLVPLLALHLSS